MFEGKPYECNTSSWIEAFIHSFLCLPPQPLILLQRIALFCRLLLYPRRDQVAQRRVHPAQQALPRVLAQPAHALPADGAGGGSAQPPPEAHGMKNVRTLHNGAPVENTARLHADGACLGLAGRIEKLVCHSVTRGVEGTRGLLAQEAGVDGEGRVRACCDEESGGS